MTLKQIPTQINEVDLNNIQKMQLLNNGIITTPTLSLPSAKAVHKQRLIILDKNLFQLKIQKNIRQH